MANQPQQNRRPQKAKDERLGGAELVMERAFFYRDSFRKMTTILVAMSVSIIILIATSLFFWKLSNDKEKYYFAMSPTGSVIQMIPFTEPAVPESRMLQIVGDAATCVFTYDHVNYRSQISLCQDKFTTEGWDKFTLELGNSKILQLVTKEKLVLSATRVSAPVVVDKGIINGSLAWKVEVPIRVNFVSRGGTSTEDYLIKMTVSRVSQMEYSDGVAIMSFVATKM